MPNFLITPQGNFINLLDGTRPSRSGAVITWANSVATVVTETYNTILQAQTTMAQAIQAVTNPSTEQQDTANFQNNPLPPPTTPNWGSLSPSTTSIGNTNLAFTIAGSNFQSSIITNLKLINGGSTLTCTFTISSDTSIAANSGGTAFVAGTYNLQYSNDGGSTWITAGTLTIVAS